MFVPQWTFRMPACSQGLGCDYSCGGELTAPSPLPTRRMFDLLWGAGNSLCFDRLHIAAHETGSCRSSWTPALILFWGLFLSKTETRGSCQMSYFSRKDTGSPTGDFIALESRQGNLCLWDSRAQPFLSLSPLRSRPAIQHGLINSSSNAEFPPPMLLLALQSYAIPYHISILFYKFCK